MKIFFPDIHHTLTKGFCQFCSLYGFQVLIPSADYKVSHRCSHTPFVWDESHSKESAPKTLAYDKVFAVSKEELLDEKPDVIFVTAYENQFEILREIYPLAKQWGAKLCFYSGNDYWETAYPWRQIPNYLCVDQTSLGLCKYHGVNHLHWFPWVDYETFAFCLNQDSNIIGSYIVNYSKAFPRDFEKWLSFKKQDAKRQYILHMQSPKQQTVECMRDSAATLHIKTQEGYGYAIIESLAIGRPVFLDVRYSRNRTYLNWCLDGETSFFFGEYEDYLQTLNNYMSDLDYRCKIQSQCSSKIREVINNQEQSENLKCFLEKLK